jgi:hypothetical protein
MLAVAVTKPPEGPAWAYELQFDGYRGLAMKAAGQVRLFSRNGKDFTRRFASIARALEALPDETVIDGEIIAYNVDGRPSFNVCRTLGALGPKLPMRAQVDSTKSMWWSALVTLIAQGTRCARFLTRTNEKTRQLQSLFRKGGLHQGWAKDRRPG